MWTAVLFFGFGLALDPLRLGLVAVVLSHRQPLRNLVAFWLGGVVAGVALGVVVLILFREVALTAIEHLTNALNGVRTSVAILAGGGLQITLGLVLLLILCGLVARQKARVGQVLMTPPDVIPQRPPNVFTRLAVISQNMLTRGIWPAFLVGLGSATPPVECVMLLTIIMASGAAIGTQMAAVVVFTLLVLALVEIPLITYLAMPQKTEAVMLRVNAWLNVHRRRILQTLLAVTAIVLLVRGMVSL